MTHARLATVVACLLAGSASLAQDAERVSEFGRYEGWSEERFDGWKTTSRYVEMRDGVRLAVDVTRPTVGGEVATEPLPVVWTHSRYHRNPSKLVEFFGGDGSRIRSNVDTNPGLQRLVRHGYVVAAAGVRGSGASFGRYQGLFSDAETKDAAELIAWFAEQPWCDGNVGMYGGSYLGITQYMAASEAPPALKAICPDVAAFDMYDLLYAGGVFRDDMMRHWDGLTDQLDAEAIAPPVTDDEDGSLLREAVAEHADNWQVFDGYRSVPFRDDAAPGIDWSKHGPAPRLEAIQDAAVPIYHLNGWLDIFAHDTCQWFVNYRGPQRMMMGAWAHAEVTPERMRLTAIEQHRWFDRWLKGIENGVDEGDRAQFALVNEPGDVTWVSTDVWPPEGVQGQAMWFDDGALVPTRPDDAGALAYDIDRTTTTGSASRWDNAVGAAPMGVRYDLAANEARSLTFTSEPMEEDLVLVGHPVVHLALTASAGDADLFVVLSEVDAAGRSRYLTEAVVRGSMRREGEPSYDNLGLPWHRCFEEDAEPLPSDEPALVSQDLHPIAQVVQAGHRVRVAVFCADRDNAEPSPVELPASIAVHLGESRIVLPVLRNRR
ncbi:MAG: CocE/NonD family hydrolase [Planctomycetota bacterium]